MMRSKWFVWPGRIALALIILGLTGFALRGRIVQIALRSRLREAIGEEESLQQYRPGEMAAQLESGAAADLPILHDLSSVDELESAFDDDAGVPRLVLLLAPT